MGALEQCFDKKNKHIGKLKELNRFDTDWDCEAVVKWCPRCGAIVIDRVVDGRRMGTYNKMQFPKTAKKPTQRIHKSLWEEEWTLKG